MRPLAPSTTPVGASRCGRPLLALPFHLSVSLREPAPLEGSHDRCAAPKKPPLEGRWHGASHDGEVCAGTAVHPVGADIIRPLLALSFHLSVSLREPAPLEGSHDRCAALKKPPLEGRWHGASHDGEVCAGTAVRIRTAKGCGLPRQSADWSRNDGGSLAVASGWRSAAQKHWKYLQRYDIII